MVCYIVPEKIFFNLLAKAEFSAYIDPWLLSFRDERRPAFQVGRRVLTCGDEMLCLELENGVWLAEGEGDPPRTLDPDNAKLFWPKEKAETALKDARRFRAFENAKIYLALDPETLYA